MEGQPFRAAVEERRVDDRRGEVGPGQALVLGIGVEHGQVGSLGQRVGHGHADRCDPCPHGYVSACWVS